MLFDRYWPQTQAFQEFIKRIFRVRRASPCQQFPNYVSSQIVRFPKIICFKTDSGFFLNCLEYPGVFTDKEYCFWESWTRPPSQKTKQMVIFGLSQHEIDKLLNQNEAE